MVLATDVARYVTPRHAVVGYIGHHNINPKTEQNKTIRG
jgi:hypothetical protein